MLLECINSSDFQSSRAILGLPRPGIWIDRKVLPRSKLQGPLARRHDDDEEPG